MPPPAPPPPTTNTSISVTPFGTLNVPAPVAVNVSTIYPARSAVVPLATFKNPVSLIVIFCKSAIKFSQ
jgi:hypothetical protein